MDSASNTTRDLATIFLNCNRMENFDRAALAAAIQASFEILRLHLSQRLGGAGYRALLARALVISKTHSVWTEALRIDNEGSLVGFDDASVTESLSSVIEGSVEIVTCLIDLLETFIGRDLSIRLLSDLLPKEIVVEKIGTKEDRNG